MPYQLTDIKIIKSDLEKKLGKEELEKAIKNIYNRDYIKKNNNLPFEKAEERILRGLHKCLLNYKRQHKVLTVFIKCSIV